MEEIIRVENLTHTYGEGTPFCRSAVQDMSLAIYRGEFLGIIGHTGSGKSTLIQHLNGLLKPTSGRILLGGEDIWADPKKIRNVRFRVGLVFQYPEYQLFEETVYRDIAFGPTNMGLSKDEIDRRVRESAHFAGLTDDLLEKSPFALSGGQKRRVAIAGIIPIGATLGAISWFYVMKKDELLAAVNTGSKKERGALWYNMGRFVYVPLAVILCCVALFMHVAF